MTTRLAALVSLFLILFVSCARNDKAGSKRFLLPWPGSGGQSQLKIVSINTLNSPYQLSGPAAKIYLQSSFTNSGFAGDPAKPNMTMADGVFIPLDTQSSLGLVLYAHMERLLNLDRELGIDSDLNWPRNVGYEILLETRDARSLEFNNARYFLDWDVMAFMPTNNGATSLALNPGVIAHEHYHAHFNFRVQKHILSLKVKTPADIFNDEVLMRGWSEGLADYYGFVYSKNPEFLKISLGPSIGTRRKINLDEPSIIRSASYHFGIFQAVHQSNQPVGGLGYSIGTDLAKTLYTLVELPKGSSPIDTHKKMLKFVTDRLERIPEWIQSQEKGQILEPAALLDIIFFQSDEMVLSLEQCELLHVQAPYYFQNEFLEGKCLKH